MRLDKGVVPKRYNDSTALVFLFVISAGYFVNENYPLSFSQNNIVNNENLSKLLVREVLSDKI